MSHKIKISVLKPYNSLKMCPKTIQRYKNLTTVFKNEHLSSEFSDWLQNLRSLIWKNALLIVTSDDVSIFCER